MVPVMVMVGAGAGAGEGAGGGVGAGTGRGVGLGLVGDPPQPATQSATMISQRIAAKYIVRESPPPQSGAHSWTGRRYVSSSRLPLLPCPRGLYCARWRCCCRRPNSASWCGLHVVSPELHNVDPVPQLLPFLL